MGNNQQSAADANGDTTSAKASRKSKTRTVIESNVHQASMKSAVGNADELTFAERLGHPDSTPKQQEKQQKAANDSGKAPRVASNVAVLTSALASNDKHQLQTVLDQQDMRVISATVLALPLGSVLPLLLELMNRFSRKPSASLAGWLRFVLITHQAYLTSLPNLISRLSGLYNFLDDRLKTFPDLLRLNGRFELLLSHIEPSNSGAADDSAPFNTYFEGADDADFDDDGDDDDDDDDDEEAEEDDDADDFDDAEDDDASADENAEAMDVSEDEAAASGSEGSDSDEDDD